ncbi:MAG TPA: M28 family metallopeptidase [Actinomycetota bacterium]|jgi:Zn-dependent M28 family amino/carboxypeptidase|nr:M28 family metallopeptidase [Actinomycetota bacterium]
MTRSRWVRAAVALSATALVAGGITTAGANPKSSIASTQGFRKQVTLAGIQEHLQAFQSFSDAHGGNRAGGSPGFEASADYVAQRAAAAGLNVSSHYFNFVYNADRTPPEMSQTSPNAVTYTDGVDFASMTYSPSGDVSAPVVAVDLVLPPGPTDNSNTSGCESSDFAGFPAGSIALVQRGTCAFAVKGQNAAAAGAAGVIVFNEGQPGRTGVINGTLGGPQSHGAPVVGTTFAVGDDLANGVTNGDTGSTVRLRVDRVEENRLTRNVIAETPGGDANSVVVVGAHLDSVPRGAGINDNGSGSATILEVAEVLGTHAHEVRNKVRFMWFGAEEFGLLGSAAYVSSLSQAERDKIELMLNFDMIGSPNFVRFVYDGDNSAFAVGPNVQQGPAGSGAIEQAFVDYFNAMGLASEPTPFNGRSDYGPFIAQGIPAGGLFTGAEGVKTAAQAAVYGGTAGQSYDPCYHLRCDTLSNVNPTGLDQMSDAVAHAVLTFARRDFARSPLVDPPPGPGGGGGGGGGLHEDHEEESH